MSQAERLLLFEAFKRLCHQPLQPIPDWLPPDSIDAWRPSHGVEFFEKQIGFDALLQQTLEEADRLAGPAIRFILGDWLPHFGSPVGILPTDKAADSVHLDLEGRVRFGGHSGNGSPVLQSLRSLFQPGKVFPIARCERQECRSYFARSSAQKFCSPRCQSKVREAARAGTEARRETLRRAAKEYRERQKQSRKARRKVQKGGGIPRKEGR